MSPNARSTSRRPSSRSSPPPARRPRRRATAAPPSPARRKPGPGEPGSGEPARERRPGGVGRPGRGRAQHHRLGRLRRGRLEPAGIRLGQRVPGGRPAAKVNVKTDDTSDQMVTRHAHRRTGYDGVSASGDALAGSSPADVAPIDPARSRASATSRRSSRDAPHYVVDGATTACPTAGAATPLMYNTETSAGADELGRRVRPGQDGRLQGQGHRLRQPDLHRRRRPVPQGAQAGPGHHRSVRADPAAVRRGRRAAQGAAPVRGQVLVGGSAREIDNFTNGTRRSAPAWPYQVEHAAGPGCRSRRSCPARA